MELTMEHDSRTLKDKQEANGRTLALNGKAWATLRDSVLLEHPLCEHCMDASERLTPATEVDHVDNDPTNNRHSNLASLCKSCHSRKTNAEMGRNVTFGCDIKGMPLDPRHPWNLEKSPATKADEPTGNPFVSANRKGQP
jgi:5-methylcytosine-specific restriction protein A